MARIALLCLLASLLTGCGEIVIAEKPASPCSDNGSVKSSDLAGMISSTTAAESHLVANTSY